MTDIRAFTAFDAAIDAMTGKDVRRGFRLWRVYRHLRAQLAFHEARPVKVTAIHLALRMRLNAVIECLDWLTEHGYLMEHGRTDRGVRQLRLAFRVHDERESA